MKHALIVDLAAVGALRNLIVGGASFSGYSRSHRRPDAFMQSDHHPSATAADDSNMFELAPVSLWLEDASDVHTLFQEWKADGMTCLRERLQRPECMSACLSKLKILKINLKTLDLFEADDFQHFLTNLHRIVTIESMDCIIDQWVELWEGKTKFFGKTVNTTLTGRVLDVQIRGNLLPGYEANWGRVLIAIEDVTDLETARRAVSVSESYARGLFEHSSVSLFVKDFSEVKGLLEHARRSGIRDLQSHFESCPEFRQQCIGSVHVRDVNREAVRLFEAANKDSLLSARCELLHQSNIDEVERQIIGLWQGHFFQQRDVVSHTLSGRSIFVQIQLSVLPNHEADWAKVLIARVDISKRKEIEANLEYISNRDPITGLYNRRFFLDDISSLDNSKTCPVSIIMIDLNGLKTVNDTLGHAAGDAYLRRCGQVLGGFAMAPAYAARIGGDEFVLVMPGADDAQGRSMVRAILKKVNQSNRNIADQTLSFAIGHATSMAGEGLEAVVSRADAEMYKAKRSFYSRSGKRLRGNAA